jgi:hypothetical protein
MGRLRINLWATLVAVTTLTAGCTLIGMGMGYAADTEKTSVHYGPRTMNQRELHRGDHVVVYLKNGQRVEATFLRARPSLPNDPRVYLIVRERTEDSTTETEYAPGMKDEDWETKIATADVNHVDVAGGKHWWLIGAALGLAADIAVVIWVDHRLDHCCEH